MTILYGIKNCDSVKKAKKWLEQANIPYQFHDFRSDGFSAELLQELLTFTDLSALLIKRPLLKHNQALLVGFKDSQYQQAFI